MNNDGGLLTVKRLLIMVDLDEQLYIEAALAKNLPLWRLENRSSLKYD